jgi:hypothetical protein
MSSVIQSNTKKVILLNWSFTGDISSYDQKIFIHRFSILLRKEILLSRYQSSDIFSYHLIGLRNEEHHKQDKFQFSSDFCVTIII